MATVNQNRPCLRPRNKNLTDFSKVGGLSSHIKLLREIIIFPLLYGELYKHFNVKAPRGVLFFGPPGTGKTLVAGALATELNREGNGKVTFYQRKGADILDKWVGESERKLRDLFHQAIRNRPSVIFFDELDGLAPVRSQKNDQVHCSVVATLLALMDGLDNTSGVVVIGATNRIDAIDPALRRPGRFDRELYFPLPSVNGRKEILQVHTHSWINKPRSEFLSHMSDLTSGCCGADLQALCAEAFLCCLKRLYPNLHRPMLGNKIRIEAESIVIEEIDFLNARINIVPTNQRLGNYRVRKLSHFIKPLLQRQLDKIIKYIQILLPQFTQPFKKFLIGSERYVGRLILKGRNQQGLTIHIMPAILQTLEHIPCYILDVPSLFESSIKSARQNLPSILVLSRVDDWWELIDNTTQLSLIAMLEDLHAGLPLLLIATCSEDLPDILQDYFYNNSNIVIKIEDPTFEEREQFFAPLFFGNNNFSVYKVLRNESSLSEFMEIKKEMNANVKHKNSGVKAKHKTKNKFTQKGNFTGEVTIKGSVHEVNGKRKAEQISPVPTKRNKVNDEILNSGEEIKLIGERSTKHIPGKYGKTVQSNYRMNSTSADVLNSTCYSSHICGQHCSRNQPRTKLSYNVRQTLVDMIDGAKTLDNGKETVSHCNGSITSLYNHSYIKQEPPSETSVLNYNPLQAVPYMYHNANDATTSDIYDLWKRTSHVTSDGLAVAQLELLYDTISACIVVHKHNIAELIPALERTLTNFENSNIKSVEAVDGSFK